ncbi:MAG: hypothetical protein MJE68_19655 [Proteobacteria bacterium]|nr:hypothetical protein [Pseudomonadota bacterium]
MSHVQLSCQVFLNLERQETEREGEREGEIKEINSLFFFNSLQRHGEG